jgi:hypothetical protein
MVPRHERQSSSSIRPTQKKACAGASGNAGSGALGCGSARRCSIGPFSSARFSIVDWRRGFTGLPRSAVVAIGSRNCPAAASTRMEAGQMTCPNVLGQASRLVASSHVGMLLASSLQALTFMAEFFSAEPLWLAKNSETRTMRSALWSLARRPLSQPKKSSLQGAQGRAVTSLRSTRETG